jgi:enamine deaminase RidA (YjgF/YER057c/UK114 family)
MKQIVLFLLGVLAVSIIFHKPSYGQSRNTAAGSQKVATRQDRSRMKTKVRFINPTTLAKPPGYTHVVEVRGGRTIYISGQIALDSSGNIVGPGDFPAQAAQVFANLKIALESVGASFKDVVKLNIYVTDTSKLPALREVRDRYVNTATPPASTLVQVVRLAREGLMIEIEAVAVLP